MNPRAAKRSLRGPLTFVFPLLAVAALVGCAEDDAGSSSAAEPKLCDSISFEAACISPGLVNVNGGETTLIDNPDTSGINSSARVAQMIKRNAQPFGGTRLALPLSVDVANGASFGMKVRAARAVPVTFRLEDRAFNEVERVASHSGSGDWETLCFDFANAAADSLVSAYTVIFDDGVNGQVETGPGNWTFEYDDIEQLDSCEGIGANVGVVPRASLFLSNGEARLIRPDNYAEVTPFGSGSVIDPLFSDDATFSSALSVFSGSGYGVQVAQIAFTGFRPGFLGAYQSIDFKVKGLPNQVVFVKLLTDVDAVRITLNNSARSEPLGDGWFQVSIPVATFSGIAAATGLVLESDGSSAEAFRMLLTDVGFSGVGNRPLDTPAAHVPDDVLFTSDADVAVNLAAGVDYAGFDPFDSGSVFDDNVGRDADFSPAFGITSGDGYGAQVGQLAVVGFAEGFARGFDALLFKAKGLNNDLIRLRLLSSDVYLDINLTDSIFSTALSNDWYQVMVPMAAFDGVSDATGLVFETDTTAPETFTFLLTDIGFNKAVRAGPGSIPDAVIYASNPDEIVDLVQGEDYSGFDPFGSGASFEENNAGDADFNPAFAVTTGDGYGVELGQLALTGFADGFANAYGALSFKAKGLHNDLIRVKFLPSDPYVDIDLINSSFSTALGNDWFQVVVPIAEFAAVETANTLLFETDGGAAESFTFLLTDVGFNPPSVMAVPADVTLDAIVYATDPGVIEALAPTDGIQDFGSAATFDPDFRANAAFSPALRVSSGEGFGEGVHVGSAAFAGYSAGFAADFATFHFKVRADVANLLDFEVKFFGPDTVRNYDLTTYDGATALDNGWYQVSIPMSDFAEHIATNDGFLLGPAGSQAQPFAMLLTDIGFSGTNPSLIPETVAYATDSAVTVDFAPPDGVQNFGSDAVFDFAFAGDDAFNLALQITSGEGFGDGIHVGFAAFTGYATGFATDFDTLLFKVRGDAENLSDFEVRFFGPDTARRYDITSYAGATLLASGWYQVSIPLSDFSENIADYGGFLLGPFGGQAAPFTLLLTDIGFSGPDEQ